MDFMNQVFTRAHRSDRGPFPASGMVVHGDPELRRLYARHMRQCLVHVEDAPSLEQAQLLLPLLQPSVMVVEIALANPREGRRVLRRWQEQYPGLAIATVGDGSGQLIAHGHHPGIQAHISPAATRIGAVAEMVRSLIGHLS